MAIVTTDGHIYIYILQNFKKFQPTGGQAPLTPLSTRRAIGFSKNNAPNSRTVKKIDGKYAN